MIRYCFVCGEYGAQKCHVKDKAVLECLHHDFHNIIYLCPHHHYQYFDNRRLAIVPGTEQFLLLHCVKNRRITVENSKYRVYVASEYVSWKNSHIHVLLKSELRRYT